MKRVGFFEIMVLALLLAMAFKARLDKDAMNHSSSQRSITTQQPVR